MVPAPAELGVGMIGVPTGSDITLDLRIESVVEGVLVTGTAVVDLVGECSRCLDEITGSQTVDLQELFFHPGQAQDMEDSEVIDEMIDLEIPLRDAVVLGLPFTPLCADDCRGLCSQCGASLNDDPGHSHADQVDPRWSKLAGLNPSEADQ